MKKAQDIFTYQGIFNTVLSVALFSLLIVSMGMKLDKIKTMMTWANAESFASAMSTRAYTSRNCFAYETTTIFDNNGEVVEVKKTFPGVIDVRKFTEDRYFDCIQNYYASEGSELTGSTVPPYTSYIVDFTLKDLIEPEKIKKLGDKLSTKSQIEDYKKAEKEWVEKQKRIDKAFNIWGMAVSITVSVAFNTLITLFAPGMWPEINFELKNKPAVFETNVDEGFNLFSEYASEEYKTEVPVTIRYVDDQGNILADHPGILITTIHYLGV